MPLPPPPLVHEREVLRLDVVLHVAAEVRRLRSAALLLEVRGSRVATPPS